MDLLKRRMLAVIEDTESLIREDRCAKIAEHYAETIADARAIDFGNYLRNNATPRGDGWLFRGSYMFTRDIYSYYSSEYLNL